ncbi:MAG: hypothetical protein RI884_2220 [Pseudomonadota bacterium]|jgi:chromosome segregation ATPase
MALVLQKILAVSDYREARAQAAVREVQAALVQATRTHQTAEDRLCVFREEADRREAELLQGLVGKTVRIREISAVNSEIGELRANLKILDEAVQKAEQARVQVQDALTERKAAHSVAWRHQQKITDLVQGEALRSARQGERREESEVGEVMDGAISPERSTDRAGGGNV